VPKRFLIEHGVSAGSIEIRSFGKEDTLDSAQVKQQIHDNPDLNEDDRQKMLNNLPVFVLANNRRVDISLSTTGQQSVRRYPFNAKRCHVSDQ
jgi:outer membrane protein OmpA-like peptidoglycan-associated protein